MYSSGSSTPDLGYYKLPPIITTEADREFLYEVNAFIESELEKINHLDEEQRYLVYKTVFNKVIEHVTSYKPVLVQIKKEYEDTIDTIKKGQREATFLQEKLKAMASEPSTLRNYRKRGDELEERIAILKKKNGQLQQELHQIKLVKEEKEKRPKTAEKPERELKKDSRLIPGLSIEESTDMKVLQKKHETLDRQLKELSLSLRARFLPKTHKLQLKESLDNKVTYRDQLLWQSQVYKARGQKLKIALEAAQAYNQMKPPHQTVGDAVTIAFQQASGLLKAEREKTEGDQNDTAQTATFEDDDPNKEKEAEMMLEYIEKFNELFEDGLFEEAAVHAANSPKGILRTQATLAKFRDVKVKTKGRSPLLAFCDSIMSSVRAAGSRPNEALSMDCMAACLNENRLDLAYHWLSQDRLTQSLGLGRIISDHCSCPLPCKCGCQALAQSVFTKLKCHQDVVLSMLKQGKSKGALQYGRLRQCINDENISQILDQVCNQGVVAGLMERDLNGNKCLPDLNLGSLLQTLVSLEKIEMVSNLIQMMLKLSPMDGDATTTLLSLQNAVMQDTSTAPDQWMIVLEALGTAGFQDSMHQLLAMTFVVDIVQQAYKTEQENMKKGGVSFSHDVLDTKKPQCDDDDEEEEEEEEGEESDEEDNDEGDSGKFEDDAKESSIGLSSRSRDDTNTSIDHSSRETSPEIARRQKQTTAKESILKKKHHERQPEKDVSSSECSPRKSSPVARKRMVKMSRKKAGAVPTGDQSDDDEGIDNGGNNKEANAGRRRVRMNLTPTNNEATLTPEKEGDSRVKFNDDAIRATGGIDGDSERQNDVGSEHKPEKFESRVSFVNEGDENESQKPPRERSSATKKSVVKFDVSTSEEEESSAKVNDIKTADDSAVAGKTTCEKGVKFAVEDEQDKEETVAESSRNETDITITVTDKAKPSSADPTGVENNKSKPRVGFVDDCSANDSTDKKKEESEDINVRINESSSPKVRFVDDDTKCSDEEKVACDDGGKTIDDNNSQKVKFVDDCSKDASEC